MTKQLISFDQDFVCILKVLDVNYDYWQHKIKLKLFTIYLHTMGEIRYYISGFLTHHVYSKCTLLSVSLS